MFNFKMTANAALEQLSREREVEQGQMWLCGTEPVVRMGYGQFNGKPNRRLARLAGLLGMRGLTVYTLAECGAKLKGFDYSRNQGHAAEWADEMCETLEHFDGYCYMSAKGNLTVAVWADQASISYICQVIDLWAERQFDHDVLLPEPIELMSCADRRDAYMTSVAAEYEAQLARRYPEWYRKQQALHHKRWERAHGR